MLPTCNPAGVELLVSTSSTDATDDFGSWFRPAQLTQPMVSPVTLFIESKAREWRRWLGLNSAKLSGYI